MMDVFIAWVVWLLILLGLTTVARLLCDPDRPRGRKTMLRRKMS